jgi:hypothetical protein
MFSKYPILSSISQIFSAHILLTRLTKKIASFSSAAVYEEIKNPQKEIVKGSEHE